ncbi:MAG: hypothetical protein QOE70_4338 [Chthoniobacter sp.]|jgi:hypothetical protein|nr:hypothetical protein [Chthoniobacter sp.]
MRAPKESPAETMLLQVMREIMGALASAVPGADETRKIIHDAAIEVAKRESQWLTTRQAAAHCGWSLRTFQRKRDELGIPYSEIFGDPEEDETGEPKKRVPLQRYLRADLDAVLAAHVVYPAGPQLIPFPSVALRASGRASSAA